MRYMQTIIKVDHLSKTFGDFTAVNDLSFSVQEGDVYGFLGQNGAGKSTTIRMLLTLIRPTAGEMELFGYNLFSHRKEILRNIGAVIERPDLYKYLSGFENLSLFAKMSGVHLKRSQLMDQLELVGIANRSADKVKTYSQGMKQRLGLAIALVHNPQLIVLDEPTNGLDPQGIADMRNLILMLSRKMKKTVFVSSHLLSEVEQVANRMLIIDKGRKLVEGTVVDLFAPDETIVHIKTADTESCRLVLAESVYRERIQEVHVQELTVKVKREEVPVLTAFLVAKNVPVLGIAARHSLEDYFLKITSSNQHVEAFTN